MAFTISGGGDWALSNKTKKEMDRARGEALAEAQNAAEERQSVFGQYEELRNEVSGIEEEIEQASAMGEPEISTNLPWEHELVDRTKK